MLGLPLLRLHYNLNTRKKEKNKKITFFDVERTLNMSKEFFGKKRKKNSEKNN
jgi:hypothetical protein